MLLQGARFTYKFPRSPLSAMGGEKAAAQPGVQRKTVGKVGQRGLRNALGGASLIRRVMCSHSRGRVTLRDIAAPTSEDEEENPSVFRMPYFVPALIAGCPVLGAIMARESWLNPGPRLRRVSHRYRSAGSRRD